MPDDLDPHPVTVPPPTADPRRRPAYRLGPMVFVPEFFRTGKGDPWAHRKGEPRFFALLWAVYLMVASLATIFAVRSLGVPTVAQYRAGATAMLTLVALGCSILWPMTRLSQASPRRPWSSVAADVLVLLLPVQAVIWPMPVLTGWPMPVVGWVCIMITSWTLLTGVVLAWGLGSRQAVDRTLAAAICIALAASGPLLLALWGIAGRAGDAPAWVWLSSPLTGVWELLRSPSGLRPSMNSVEKLGSTLPALLAGVLALATAATAGARAERERQMELD